MRETTPQNTLAPTYQHHGILMVAFAIKCGIYLPLRPSSPLMPKGPSSPLAPGVQHPGTPATPGKPSRPRTPVCTVFR